MSNIPLARSLLASLSKNQRSSTPHDPMLVATIIDAIMKHHMVRERPVRRTPTKSRKMTAKLAREIRAHAKGHPKASVQQIANAFSLNPGRVSEALARKW